MHQQTQLDWVLWGEEGGSLRRAGMIICKSHHRKDLMLSASHGLSFLVLLFAVLFWSSVLMCHVLLFISSLWLFSHPFSVFTCVPSDNHHLPLCLCQFSCSFLHLCSCVSLSQLPVVCFWLGSWFHTSFLLCTFLYFLLVLVLLFTFSCFLDFGLLALCW